MSRRSGFPGPAEVENGGSSHIPAVEISRHLRRPRPSPPSPGLRCLAPGRRGNAAASLAARVSDTTSQHAGWPGDAGKAGHRDSLAAGVSRAVHVAPKSLFECMASGGDYGPVSVPWFNGGFFKPDEAVSALLSTGVERLDARPAVSVDRDQPPRAARFRTSRVAHQSGTRCGREISSLWLHAPHSQAWRRAPRGAALSPPLPAGSPPPLTARPETAAPSPGATGSAGCGCPGTWRTESRPPRRPLPGRGCRASPPATGSPRR